MTGRERLVLAIQHKRRALELAHHELKGLEEGLSLYDEAQEYHNKSVVARCQAKRTKPGEGSGGEQVPCTAVRFGDGSMKDACDDPCRFVMGKDGTEPKP